MPASLTLGDGAASWLEEVIESVVVIAPVTVIQSSKCQIVTWDKRRHPLAKKATRSLRKGIRNTLEPIHAEP